jgi:hypothetical protein
VQAEGHSWNATLRYVEINRVGVPDDRHSLSPTPQRLADVLLTHRRETGFGLLDFGLGYQHLDDELSGNTDGDVEAFVRWTSR